MPTFVRAILATLIIAISSQLFADGINNPKSGGSGGGQVGFVEGINNLGIGGSIVGCAGTGFDFTQACNSQYIAPF